MSLFESYLSLGFSHISDLGGYDHILFLVALCAVYRVKQWKNVLILVTAFTIGHSISLAIATLGKMNLSSEMSFLGATFSGSQLIEFLIPVTIALTAIFNIFQHTGELTQKEMRIQYLMASGFGLIHGLGFSNYLQALLGREESLFTPLLAFNIGLELGQIMIVAIIVGIGYIFLNLLKAPMRDWAMFVSGIAFGVALLLMADTKFW